MIKYARGQPNNPAVVWLGYNPNDQRPLVSWSRALEIDVRAIVSKGLNRAWADTLKDDHWNFFRFVTTRQSTYKNEYDHSGDLSDERKWIIGIVHPERPGEVEMIDGSHRLASMILKNLKTVNGYVGVY